MAKNLRVHELAKELGMTNAEMMALCDRMGVGVKSHSSTLIEAQADRLRRRAEKDGLTRPEQPEEPKPVKKVAKKAPKDDAAGEPVKKAVAKKAAAPKAAAKKVAAKPKPADDVLATAPVEADDTRSPADSSPSSPSVGEADDRGAAPIVASSADVVAPAADAPAAKAAVLRRNSRRSMR